MSTARELLQRSVWRPYVPDPTPVSDIVRVFGATRYVARQLVYFLTLRGTVVYIGYSRNIEQRIVEHRTGWSPKRFGEVYVLDPGEADIEQLTRALIRILKPLENVLRGRSIGAATAEDLELVRWAVVKKLDRS